MPLTYFTTNYLSYLVTFFSNRSPKYLYLPIQELAMFALHSFYDYESNNTESIGLDKKTKKNKTRANKKQTRKPKPRKKQEKKLRKMQVLIFFFFLFFVSSGDSSCRFVFLWFFFNFFAKIYFLCSTRGYNFMSWSMDNWVNVQLWIFAVLI